MARAESFTEDGAWPSAQLIDVSAVALDAVVRDHDQNAIAGTPWNRYAWPMRTMLIGFFAAMPGHTPDEKIDLGVSICSLVLFFVLLYLLPREAFWYWIVPYAVFWVRFNYVMLKREQLLPYGGEQPTRRDSSKGRISIADRSHQVAVPGEHLHPHPKPRRIVRRQ